ncbi:rhomboid family intramembrane serine protease [archaeon]|jgi:membrane associated rhomboid family serine protease|nr:rhomboid family intramembrane serine protease [archaeon]
MSVYQIYPNKKKKSFFSNWSLNYQLIFLNVIFFIVAFALIGFNVITWDFIAINPFNIFQGLYVWTFLTSMFMHGGLFHLFVNMLSLFFVGGLIEKILGKKRYLWFYLSAGLFAGLLFVLSALFIPSSMNSYAVGASGALFGLIGLLIFLTPNLKVYAMFIPIPIKMKYAAPGLLIVLWLISVAGDVPIGNMAHLGGLIFGIAYGLILRFKFPNKVKYISRHFS